MSLIEGILYNLARDWNDVESLWEQHGWRQEDWRGWVEKWDNDEHAAFDRGERAGNVHV